MAFYLAIKGKNYCDFPVFELNSLYTTNAPEGRTLRIKIW